MTEHYYDGVTYHVKNGDDPEGQYYGEAYKELKRIAEKYDTNKSTIEWMLDDLTEGAADKTEEFFQEIQSDAADSVKYCFDVLHDPPLIEIPEGFYTSVSNPSNVPKQVGGSHYEQYGDYQPILVMNEWLTDEQLIGFCRGNVLKYVARMGSKGNATEDAKKAKQYLEWLIEALEKSE